MVKQKNVKKISLQMYQITTLESQQNFGILRQIFIDHQRQIIYENLFSNTHSDDLFIAAEL